MLVVDGHRRQRQPGVVAVGVVLRDGKDLLVHLARLVAPVELFQAHRLVVTRDQPHLVVLGQPGRFAEERQRRGVILVLVVHARQPQRRRTDELALLESDHEVLVAGAGRGGAFQQAIGLAHPPQRGLPVLAVGELAQVTLVLGGGLGVLLAVVEVVGQVELVFLGRDGGLAGRGRREADVRALVVAAPARRRGGGAVGGVVHHHRAVRLDHQRLARHRSGGAVGGGRGRRGIVGRVAAGPGINGGFRTRRGGSRRHLVHPVRRVRRRRGNAVHRRCRRLVAPCRASSRGRRRRRRASPGRHRARYGWFSAGGRAPYVRPRTGQRHDGRRPPRRWCRCGLEGLQRTGLASCAQATGRFVIACHPNRQRRRKDTRRSKRGTFPRRTVTDRIMAGRELQPARPWQRRRSRCWPRRQVSITLHDVVEYSTCWSPRTGSPPGQDRSRKAGLQFSFGVGRCAERSGY